MFTRSVAGGAVGSGGPERDGLPVRTVYPTVPPRVEYTATEMARELHDSLATLVGWAERHRTDIAAARTAYDRRPADPAA